MVDDGSRILIAHGARGAEEALVGEVDRLLPAGRPGGAASALASLARPVIVVVPSRSLRLHLASELVRRRGRAIAGLQVTTLFGLAAGVLERSGEPLPAGEGLFDVLVRRFGREVPALARALDALVEGYGAAAVTVRDFLDAGFEADLADALAEAALAARARAGDDSDGEGRAVGTASERERAEALVRLAGAVERGMSALGVGRQSTLLRRATDLLRSDPERLPARAILVHGFADATGLAADLLETLLGRAGSVLVLDRPPDPSQDGVHEAAFTERFAERMARAAERVEEAPPAGEAPASPLLAAITAFTASGARAEAREVARRVRALVDGGTPPEAIGVVARTLAPDRPHAVALRGAFEELGVPFSGVGALGPLLPEGRRLRALLELVRRREAAPVDRWLDALPSPPGGGPPHRLFELRLAFHTLGAGRLAEVAELPPGRFGSNGFPLPVRTGFSMPEEGGEAGQDEPADDPEAPAETGGRATRRRVPSEALRRAAAAARAVVGRLRGWPAEAPLAEHLARLHTLLAEDLGWPPPGAEAEGSREGTAWSLLRNRTAELARAVPGALPLAYEELVVLLERALRDAGRDPLGGAGGGVAVLDAVEARGRTFRHLFVVGLERGLFPRAVQEDPLLADDLRRSLTDLLPDLPVKLAGYDEERYLFAQLLSAAPEVTLSWRTADEDGQPLAPSPLVERLTLAGDGPEGGRRLPAPERARLLHAARPGPDDGDLPALEHTLAAGLAGDREAFGRLLPIALAESLAEARNVSPRFVLDPAALAAAHRAILDEIDPDLSTPEGRAARSRLGPYFGFLGPAGAGDPRRNPVWVTALEGLAACPWQTFLTRLLRLEPTPDPLQALPSLDPLLVGSLVHAVLEEVVRRGLAGGPGDPGGRRLDEVLAAPADLPSEPGEPRGPGEPEGALPGVRWPGASELAEILRRRSEALLAAEGIVLPGLARALAAVALPFLEAARDAEWGPAGGGEVPALAAEVDGSVAVADAGGRERTLHFRADRVDRLPERRTPTFRLTDYKTGRPLSRAARADTRTDHLLREVQAGRRLQAVAYALAASGPGPWDPAALGRYLFLAPGVAPEHREAAVWSSAVPFAEAFARAVATVLEAWDRGTFFPRLVEPDADREPRRCARCAVHEACLRGDSGARRRLAAWAEARRQPALGEPPAPPDEALLGLWRLPSKEGT